MTLPPVPYVPLDAHYPANIRKLADAIHEACEGPHYAVDIGCGEGHMFARLWELGWKGVGLEGSPEAIARIPPGRPFFVLPIDLREPFEPGIAWDVAICTEVAEHVECMHGLSVVQHVIGRARSRIVWSAAGPGQEWPGHVNLQPSGYWLELFRHLGGFTVNEERTDVLRKGMRDRRAQHHGSAGNFFILDKTAAPILG